MVIVPVVQARFRVVDVLRRLVSAAPAASARPAAEG
jgi:hypothetical protein